MTKSAYALCGLLAPILFWITYLIMSANRPEYSLLTKAISELGSLDAPDKWTWNLLGYILPGLCIALFSIGLYRSMETGKGNRVPLLGILLSGLCMTLSGLFPADFVNRTSSTMLLHTIGSLGSYLFFLLGAFSYPELMKKSPYWQQVIRPTRLFTYLTIVFGAWMFVFTTIPALGQRLVFFFYFLWIGFTALKLYQAPNTSPSSVNSNKSEKPFNGNG